MHKNAKKFKEIKKSDLNQKKSVLNQRFFGFFLNDDFFPIPMLTCVTARQTMVKTSGRHQAARWK